MTLDRPWRTCELCGIAAGMLLAAQALAGAVVPAPPPGPVQPAAEPRPADAAPARPSDQPAGSPGARPAAPPAPPPGALPSLDELLGTGRPRTDPKSEDREDLRRRLRGEEVGDAFKEAVALMGRAAERLETAHDKGVTTQRLQEDALDRLDELIASLKQNQSRPSSSRRPQPGDEPQASPQGQRSRQRGENQPTQGEPGEMDLPARRDGALGPDLQAARAAWGALPARVRDMLMQGSSDQFSSMYQRLTETYYRRLAEEGAAK
ncbi:MAG TPA: hypothetical protein VD963_07415 [Phycisphaerales bacterium]|nr:hypothetical protein [Phycisphaerales bacterium]